MSQKLSQNHLSPVKKLLAPPDIKMLYDAVVMLDVDMVHSILESQDVLAKNEYSIDFIIFTLIQKITLHHPKTYLVANDCSRAMAILKHLLMVSDSEKKNINLEFDRPSIDLLLKMIRTNDQSKEMLASALLALIDDLNYFKDELLPLYEKGIAYFNCIATHFNMSESQKQNALMKLADKVASKKTFLKAAKNVGYKNDLSKQFSKAVSQNNIKKMKALPDIGFCINSLVPDERGILRSPLFHALRAGRKDIANWLLQNKTYFPFYYPDWLLIEKFPNDIIEQITHHRMRMDWDPVNFRCTTIGGGGPVRLSDMSITLLTYFLAHSTTRVFKAMFESILDQGNPWIEFVIQSLLPDLVRINGITHIEWKIKSTYKVLKQLSHPSGIDEKLKIYWSKHIGKESLLSIKLYIALFDENSSIELPTELSLLTDDLLLLSLVKHDKTEHKIKLWDEVYKRCKLRSNEVLWAQITSQFSEAEIQNNINEVLRQDNYVIMTFFTYFNLLKLLPNDTLDIISSYVNPTIKRHSLKVESSANQKCFVDLPIHHAIERGDFVAVEKELKENPGVIDARNRKGLTLLMLCLEQIVLFSTENDQLQRENLNKIFQLCLDRSVNPTISCELDLKGKRLTLAPFHYALYQGLIDQALQLIQYNADVSKPDSQGCFPLVYCHPLNPTDTTYYDDKYYEVIQLIVNKSHEFHQKLCYDLSGKFRNNSYDPINEDVNDFKQAYLNWIEDQHQQAQQVKAFRVATLQLNLPDMINIFDGCFISNDYDDANAIILKIFKLKRSFLYQKFNIEGSSETFSILGYILANKRYDIASWIIATHTNLINDPNIYNITLDCGFIMPLLKEEHIPEDQKKQLVELCVANIIANYYKYQENHVQATLEFTRSPSLFYEIVPLIFKEPSTPRVIEYFLPSTAKILIKYCDLHEDEILKRVDFLIGVEPKLIDVITKVCTKQLQRDDVKKDRKNLMHSILKLIDPQYPSHDVEETENLQQEFTTEENAFSLAKVIDHLLFDQLPDDIDDELQKQNYLVDKIKGQWGGYGPSPITRDDVAMMDEFISSINIKPILATNNLPTNVQAALQNLLVYGAKLLREQQKSDKKTELNTKLSALREFFESAFSHEKLRLSSLKKALNTLEQADINRGTGFYRIHTFFNGFKTYTDKNNEKHLVKSTMGELAYNLMWAVKNPAEVYEEAETVQSQNSIGK